MKSNSELTWQVRDRFLEIHSRWMSLIGEYLQDPQGQILEYWRIEKADSVVILTVQRTIHGDLILLPPASYRPGLRQATLDFPGGRLPEGVSPMEAVPTILQRELGVAPEAIAEIVALNVEGWAVNSSFSNQRLFGFAAHLRSSATLSPEAIAYPVTTKGICDLLQELNCLQCRSVLMEWLRRSANPPN